MTTPASDDPYVHSYYAATRHPRPAFAPLQGAHDVDVCIVGGGYTGINAAIELAGRNYRVALLEARRTGWGCSGRNGGQFISGIAEFERLERRLGPDDARIAWEMGNESLRILRDRVERFAIDCDFKYGYFDAALTRRQLDDLKVYGDRQAQFGYPGRLTLIDRDALPGVVGSGAYVGGLLDDSCGHLHPLNLSLGEAAAAASLGVRIFENSPVVRIRGGTRPTLHTGAGSVQARFVVIAGNAYLDGLVPEMRGLVLPAASYIIGTEPLPQSLRAEILPRDSAVCDQNTLLDYYRLSADGRLLFGGRCNYTGRAPRDVPGTLVPRMLKVFPQLRGVRIDYQWGGTVAVSLLRIPQFGRINGNMFYAQGYSGHGVGPSHLAARLLAEAIAGTSERFDMFARLRHWRIPGGKWVASPALALGMMYYRLRDLL